MTEGRIARLGATEARSIATDHGLPEYMGDLSVFQIALKNPSVARALNGMLHNLLWKGQIVGPALERAARRSTPRADHHEDRLDHWRCLRVDSALERCDRDGYR